MSRLYKCSLVVRNEIIPCIFIELAKALTDDRLCLLVRNVASALVGEPALTIGRAKRHPVTVNVFTQVVPEQGPEDLRESAGPLSGRSRLRVNDINLKLLDGRPSSLQDRDADIDGCLEDPPPTIGSVRCTGSGLVRHDANEDLPLALPFLSHFLNDSSL